MRHKHLLVMFQLILIAFLLLLLLLLLLMLQVVATSQCVEMFMLWQGTG